MKASSSIGNALNVLDNAQVRQALKEMLAEPCTYEELAARGTSLDAEPEMFTRFVQSLAELSANPLPFAQLLDGAPHAWYRLSAEEVNALVAIAAQTCETSPLSASMRRHLSHGNFIRPYIDEVRAGFAHDGIDLEYDMLQDLVRGNRPTANNAEKAFLNTYTLMVEIAESGHVDCSVDGLVGYADRMVRGCNDMGNGQEEANLAIVQELANALEHIEGSPANPEDVLVGAIMAAEVIWEQQPFAALNGVMEVLVWMLFGIQGSYPALSCVPYAVFDMQDSSTHRHGAVFVASAEQTSYGLDASRYIQQRLGIVRQGLRTLERSLLALDSRDNAVLQQLEADFRLNHRQRTTMMLAAADTSFAIDVAEYGTIHNVVVATARADLQKLVDLDYLFRDHEGARVIYRVRPDLQAKVEAFAKKGTSK